MLQQRRPRDGPVQGLRPVLRLPATRLLRRRRHRKVARRRLGALAAGLCSTSTAATTPTPAQTEAMRSTAMDFAPLPASIPAMAQQLVDDGFLHFPAALNPDKTAELRREIVRFLHDIPAIAPGLAHSR